MSDTDEFYAPQSSYQSFIRPSTSAPTPYWLSLSRSTAQTSPSINGSDVLQLTFDVVAGTDTGDFTSNTWTVPSTGYYLITYNYEWGAGNPANANFASPFIAYNGGDEFSADATRRAQYYNSKIRITTTNTRIMSLTAGDTLSFKALLSSNAATTFTLIGQNGVFPYISIQKIA